MLQGDGTAHIFSGRQDVFTLSVHAANNFPARKQVRPVSCNFRSGLAISALGRHASEAECEWKASMQLGHISSARAALSCSGPLRALNMLLVRYQCLPA